jgi:Flp pilus assembly pilin Flp
VIDFLTLIGGVTVVEHILILKMGSMIIITFGDVLSADTKIASLWQIYMNLMKPIGTIKNKLNRLKYPMINANYSAKSHRIFC